MPIEGVIQLPRAYRGSTLPPDLQPGQRRWMTEIMNSVSGIAQARESEARALVEGVIPTPLPLKVNADQSGQLLYVSQSGDIFDFPSAPPDTVLYTRFVADTDGDAQPPVFKSNEGNILLPGDVPVAGDKNVYPWITDGVDWFPITALPAMDSNGNVVLPCPLQINPTGATCDPIVKIFDSGGGVPFSYLDFGAIGAISSLAASALELTAKLGDLNLTTPNGSVVVNKELVVNDDGGTGVIFRVASSTDPNFITVLGGSERFGIGAGAVPDATLHLVSNDEPALLITSEQVNVIKLTNTAGQPWFELDNSGPFGTAATVWDWKPVLPVAGGPGQILDMNSTSIDMDALWTGVGSPVALNILRTMGAGVTTGGGSMKIVQTENAGALAFGAIPFELTFTDTGAVIADVNAMKVVGSFLANGQQETLFVQLFHNTVGSAGNKYAVNSESSINAPAATPTGYRGFGQNTALDGNAVGVEGFATGNGASTTSTYLGLNGLVGPGAGSLPTQRFGLACNRNSWFDGGISYHWVLGTPLALAPITPGAILNPALAADIGSIYVEGKLQVHGTIYSDVDGIHHGWNIGDNVRAYWGQVDDASILWDGTDMRINSDVGVAGGLVRLDAASNWPAAGPNSPVAIPGTLPAVAATTFGGWLSVKDNNGNIKYIPTWN